MPESTPVHHPGVLSRWLRRNHGFADRLHAVGWDYVSTNCEVRRMSHNATELPKVP